MTQNSYLAGDIIVNEKPIVHVVHDNQKHLRCDFCLQLNLNLKICGKCGKNCYCDRNCQKHDWKWHKNECEVCAQFYDTIGGNDYIARLLLKLWLSIKAKTIDSNNQIRLFDGNSKCLNDMNSFEEHIKADNKRMLHFNELSNLFNKCGITHTTDQLLPLFGRVCTNLFTIHDYDMNYEKTAIGYGLYMSAIILRHSCAPNACCLFTGSHLQVRAIKPISCGQQVFVHFVTPDKSKTKRRSLLKSNFYLDCNCVKCLSVEDDSVDYDQFNNLLKVLRHNVFADDMDAQQTSLYSNLLSLSTKVYGEYHPDLAVILMIIMQQMLINPKAVNTSNSISQFIARVGNVIKVSFGVNHKFFHMFQVFDELKNMS